MANQQLLVVSLSGALYAIQEGKITRQDLESALFFINHSHQEAHEYIENYEGITNEAKQVLTSVLRAEVTKNIAWSVCGSIDRFQLGPMEWLAEFLRSHKIEHTEKFIKHIRPNKHLFNYPAIDAAIKAANIPLRVIRA